MSDHELHDKTSRRKPCLCKTTRNDVRDEVATTDEEAKVMMVLFRSIAPDRPAAILTRMRTSGVLMEYVVNWSERDHCFYYWLASSVPPDLIQLNPRGLHYWVDDTLVDDKRLNRLRLHSGRLRLRTIDAKWLTVPFLWGKEAMVYYCHICQDYLLDDGSGTTCPHWVPTLATE